MKFLLFFLCYNNEEKKNFSFFEGGIFMWTFYEKNKQAIHDIVLLLAAVLGCFLFFRYLFRIFLPFLIGWLLSLLFNPLADRLQKFHIPRGISAIIGILLLFALLGLLGFWSGTGLIAKLKELSENLPHYINLFEAGLAHFWTRFDTLAQRLPKALQVFFSDLQTDSSGFLLSLVPKGSATDKLGGVSGFFIAFFVSLISAYFFTKDRDLLRRQYEIHIAPLFGLSVYTTKQELKASVLGYLKTQLILMGFVFIVTLIGMLVLRSPHPLLLSILIAIIDALPFFGSGFILWPGAIYFFTRGNTFLAIGYLALYGIIQIARQILQPKILGTQIGLHPLLTLFSMYFGFKCIGVFGLILGPIVAVVLKALFHARKQNRELRKL